jgi:hypothetical protein
MNTTPCRIINATAPIRICDLGGWTDTWFAERGAVLNIGVYPYAEVQLFVKQGNNSGMRSIVVNAENFGDRYAVPLPIEYEKHPLLEACLDIMELPDDWRWKSIFIPVRRPAVPQALPPPSVLPCSAHWTCLHQDA